MQVPRHVKEPTFKWTDLDQDNIDSLNALVPDASLSFNIDSLTSTLEKFNGNLCNWIAHMNDRNISARHDVDAVIHNDWYPISTRQWGGSRGGPWRLLFSFADYAEPWKTLSWNDIRGEYATSQDPFKDYVKHVCRRYEGEVALA